VPKKPGAQTLHEATVALPAAVAVHTPAGHCAVPPALAVPEFATAPKYPGALAAQAATVVPPTAPFEVDTPAETPMLSTVFSVVA